MSNSTFASLELPQQQMTICAAGIDIWEKEFGCGITKSQPHHLVTDELLKLQAMEWLTLECAGYILECLGPTDHV